MINRVTAENMWIIVCEPETATMQDVANSVFTHNPDIGGEAEKDGISHSLPHDVPGYPFDFIVVRDAVLLKGSNRGSSCSDGDSNSNDQDIFEEDSDF